MKPRIKQPKKRRQIDLDADNFDHYTEEAKREARTLPRQVNHRLRSLIPNKS